MKKFIKNSFLTLLRSKGALVLLFIFSFLASVMFLTYANSRKSHLNAYNTTMKQGSSADISVYENYDYSFSIKATKVSESTPQGELWRFSFDHASNYVKKATKKDVSRQPHHYLVKSKAEPNAYFQPWNENASWTDYVKSDELSDYISQKSQLLSSELKSDQSIRVDAAIDAIMAKNYPQHQQWIGRHEKGLNISLDKKHFEFIQVDDEQVKLNKLVYLAGNNEHLFPKIGNVKPMEINRSFNNFKRQFDTIKKSSNPTYSVDYIEFLRGIYANFIDDYNMPEVKNALSELIKNHDYAVKHSGDLAKLANGGVINTQPLTQFLKEPSMVATDPNWDNFGHRFTLNWSSGSSLLPPKPLIVTNPCSYQAVVANANVLHGHYRYSKAAYEEWKAFITNQNGHQYNEVKVADELIRLRSKYPDSIVSLGSDNSCLFLIVGVGVTPNHMFPVLRTNPSTNIGNLDDTLFMYATAAGSSLACGSYASATTFYETLFAKFPGLSHKQIQKVVDEINQYAKDNMALFSIKSAYFVNDPSGLNLVTGLRVSFLPTLTKKISSIFIFVCMTIWFLVLVVSFFVTRDILEKNRYILSIFNSNGFSLRKLIASFVMALVLPSLLGCLFGFGAAVFTQQWMNGFLDQYWVSVSPSTAISWWSFASSFVIFNLILVSSSFMVGMFITRRNLVSSLKNELNYKSSRFEVFFKNLFFFTPIMTRLRISIAFNAVQKMLILAVMILVTIVTFGLFTSSIGKFKDAKSFLSHENSYGYAVELHTPTHQSGPIKYTNTYNLGRTADGFTNRGNDLKALRDWKNLQFSSVSTFTDYNNNISFLENMVSSRVQLDFYYGSASHVGVNLWNVVKGMMPLNQAVASDEAYREIMDYLYNCDDNKTADGKKKFIDKKGNAFVLQPAAYENIIGFNIGVSEEYASFIKKNFFVCQKALALRGKNPINNYSIAYGALGLDPQVTGGRHFYDHETELMQPPKYGFLKIDTKEGINVYGIQDNDLNDANYLGPRLYLTDGLANQAANSLLYDKDKSFAKAKQNSSTYPIIVNRAMAMDKKLKVGSVIQITPLNTIDRVSQQLAQGVAPVNPVKTKLKVVGISRGSKNPTAYIAYANANAILHAKKQKNGDYYYFNGFYASAADRMRFLNNVLSLFSPSGLYPATQDFDNNFIQLLERVISQRKPEQLKKISRALGIKENDLQPKKAREYVQILRKHYVYPFILIWKSIFSTKGDLDAFDTVSRVTSTLLILSISVIILMVFFVVILISILSLNNLKSVGVRLQVFGYDCRKILGSMLSIYLPSLMMGFCLSYPILQISNRVFSGYFFSLTGIALTLDAPIFGILIGTGVAVSLLAVSFIVCYYNFTRLDLEKSIKGFLDI